MALEQGLPQEAFDPLAAGHARLFGSFPSRSIQDRDAIRLGPLYQPFAQGAWAAQGYEDLGNLLPREGPEGHNPPCWTKGAGCSNWGPIKAGAKGPDAGIRGGAPGIARPEIRPVQPGPLSFRPQGGPSEPCGPCAPAFGQEPAGKKGTVLLHLAMPLWGHARLGESAASIWPNPSPRLTRLKFLTDRFSAQNVNGTLDYLYMHGLYRHHPGLFAGRRGASPGGDPGHVQRQPGPLGARIARPASTWATYSPSRPCTAPRASKMPSALSRCGGRRLHLVREGVLRGQGLDNTRTIIQGVDPMVFNPAASRKTLFEDRFVIFSGGKFELRKGQDLVVRAFAELARHHDDVLLVASWFNPWANYMDSMRLSRHISYRPGDGFEATMNNLLADHGLTRENVLLLPPTPHHEMARVYKNCDLGIFPQPLRGRHQPGADGNSWPAPNRPWPLFPPATGTSCPNTTACFWKSCRPSRSPMPTGVYSANGTTPAWMS